MAIFTNTVGLAALVLLCQTALAMPGPVEARVTAAPDLRKKCFSYTTTVAYTGTVACPLLPVCGPHPDCVLLDETTLSVPCKNTACPITPTVTVTTVHCPTCQTGCATVTEVATVTTGC